MAMEHQFLTGLGISIWLFVWECGHGYGGTGIMTSMGQFKNAGGFNGKVVEMTDVTVVLARLLKELDQPHDILTMAKHPFMNFSDVGCPLNLCHHVQGVVVVPHRPRLFVICLPDRRFCGLCPGGTIMRPDYRSFRCAPITEHLKNDDIEGCQIDKSCQTSVWPRLLLSMANKTQIDSFIVCSKKGSFCGFCQADVSIFNRTTLTCDEIFPETNFLCPPSNRDSVHPDPLTPCSPIAYFCTRANRPGDAVRCPIPKLRFSKILHGCDLPEKVPECGGVDGIDASDTFVELPPFFNASQAQPRGFDPTGNCVAHCIYIWGYKKNVCMRICST